eukprot:Unigene10475_Nuclearia_a/m.32014 Unigene10475_Nuclearia_a/g.32014  ORF Unigene10475_Nuclearia_a/g.32014 Unigene10475_Nuclearia_a/m.32014 type:complete len:374 (-) Unigene10475_Nuclearia_a:655-1776(-)
MAAVGGASLGRVRVPASTFIGDSWSSSARLASASGTGPFTAISTTAAPGDGLRDTSAMTSAVDTGPGRSVATGADDSDMASAESDEGDRSAGVAGVAGVAIAAGTHRPCWHSSKRRTAPALGRHRRRSYCSMRVAGSMARYGRRRAARSLGDIVSAKLDVLARLADGGDVAGSSLSAAPSYCNTVCPRLRDGCGDASSCGTALASLAGGGNGDEDDGDDGVGVGECHDATGGAAAASSSARSRRVDRRRSSAAESAARGRPELLTTSGEKADRVRERARSVCCGVWLLGNQNSSTDASLRSSAMSSASSSSSMIAARSSSRISGGGAAALLRRSALNTCDARSGATAPVLADDRRLVVDGVDDVRPLAPHEKN